MRARTLLPAAALVLAMSAGCEGLVDAFFGEPAADVSQPKTIARSGLTFSYASNWTVEVEQEDYQGVELTSWSFESPGAAIVMVMQYRPAIEPDEGLAMQFLDEMQTEVNAQTNGLRARSNGVEDVERELLGTKAPGKKKQLTISMLGETLPHTQHVYVAHLADRSIVAYSQVADEDMAKAKPGFELVLNSMKTSE